MIFFNKILHFKFKLQKTPRDNKQQTGILSGHICYCKRNNVRRMLD